VWAYIAATELDEIPNLRRDAIRRLNEAALLEKDDRSKAITAYEEIIQTYPNTFASREAKRNIEAINRKG
jgi:outer membrane protein assembly factor BamD (BamD/ComL family)